MGQVVQHFADVVLFVARRDDHGNFMLMGVPAFSGEMQSDVKDQHGDGIEDAEEKRYVG